MENQKLENNYFSMSSQLLALLFFPAWIFLINFSCSGKNFSFYNKAGRVSEDGAITLMCAAYTMLVLSAFFCNKFFGYCVTHCTIFAGEGSGSERVSLLEFLPNNRARSSPNF